jgi:hypothetical protein
VIGMFCDMELLAAEKIIGQPRASEDQFEPKIEQIINKASRLMLSKEDWVTKFKGRLNTTQKILRDTCYLNINGGGHKI